jgi:hypothetical protein
MIIRWVGLGLIAVGALFGWLFVYLPIRDGPAGFMGAVNLKALVFIPLAVVTGLGFLVGGAPVLAAFQSQRRSRAQWTVVWSILVTSTLLTGVGYWLLKTRWMPRPKGPPVIPFKPKVPPVPNPPPRFVPPTRPDSR